MILSIDKKYWLIFFSKKIGTWFYDDFWLELGDKGRIPVIKFKQ